MDQRQVREAVLIVAEVAATVATIAIVLKMLGGPDSFHRAQMRAAKGIESLCMNNATMWANLSSVAGRTYDKSRSVTL